MDDLLSKHAENVGDANTEHMTALRGLRERADAAIREKIAAFGNTMLDLVKGAEAAREKLSADLAEITAEVGDASEAAFAGNLAAISLSAADFGREFDARSSFLRTGQLPIPDQLPKTGSAQIEPPAQNDDQAQGDPDAALGGEARAA